MASYSGTSTKSDELRAVLEIALEWGYPKSEALFGLVFDRLYPPPEDFSKAFGSIMDPIREMVSELREDEKESDDAAD